jgi:predicted nucleotidyltransferase component of viral defense system
MLTVNQLRQVAARSGARDIANVEIDVLLTYLPQLFTENGLMEHLAFKGGTMLRKMVFGPRGRLSTDLDFTRRTDIPIDDLTMMLLDTLAEPYHNIEFGFDRDKDWYVTDDGSSAIPVCAHPENQKGVKIKIQISTREKPILPVLPVPQLQQDYFRLLPFAPAEIPCLAFEEAVAEKIRAASQRTKIRDLHDLSEIGRSAFNYDLIRPLAVLKLWSVGGPGLNYDRLRERIQNTPDYELGDLRNLLRKDQEPNLKAMIERVCDRFRFLSALTDVERKLAADEIKQHVADAEALAARLRAGSV